MSHFFRTGPFRFNLGISSQIGHPSKPLPGALARIPSARPGSEAPERPRRTSTPKRRRGIEAEREKRLGMGGVSAGFGKLRSLKFGVGLPTPGVQFFSHSPVQQIHQELFLQIPCFSRFSGFGVSQDFPSRRLNASSYLSEASVAFLRPGFTS